MYKATDLFAGFFVLLSLALMGFITIVIGGHQATIMKYLTGNQDIKHIFIEFDDVAGLKSGDKVKVQGLEYGKVTHIDLDSKLSNKNIVVTVDLIEQVAIRNGYLIQIKDESMLGGKSIQIDLGPKMSPPLKNIYAKDNPNILIGKASGNLMMEGGDIISENRKDIRVIVKDIKDTVKNFKGLVSQLYSGDEALSKEGTLYRLINDPSMGENVAKIISNVSDISSKIKNGEGTVGKIINDPELYNEVKKLFKDAQSALEDYREQAPISTFSGTALGAF